MADVQRLDSQAAHNIKDQHVVSQVILSNFAERWGKKQERLLAGLDLDHEGSAPRYGGTRRFGKVPNFVRFASKSIEQVWKESEDRLRAALDAIASHTVFTDPASLSTIRDAVVLHFVHSIPAVFIHENAWVQNREAAKVFALRFPHHLEDIFHQKYGVYPSGPEGLDIAFNLLISKTANEKERGALFRVGLEDKFRRYRQLPENYDVQILVPESSEFIIGDVPALAIRHGQAITGVRGGVGLATADELAMPLGPQWLAVLNNKGRAGFSNISRDRVLDYNTMQIQAAYRHVHFRPGSGLEEWIRSVDRPLKYPRLPS